VQLKLVDAPGDYLGVNVEIVDIRYNNTENEDGWVSFEAPEGTEYPINVDLTELIAGNDILLTDEVIPAGMMKQIRLVLGENNSLLVEGEDGSEYEIFPLNTPSAMQSGLKLNLDTELAGGFTYTFILDWNVQESVVDTGSGTYNLRPVIKVNAEATSGAISGKLVEVINGVETPLAGITNVMLSDDTNDWNTETNIDGEFVFQGLGAGEDRYTLTINEVGYQIHEIFDIDVTVGAFTDLETITLVVE